MDIERQLISKAVGAGDIETLVRRGVTGAHFEDDLNRQVFQTMVSHMRRYKEPPSRDAVLAAHPGYGLDIVEDATDYLIDRFVTHVKRRETQKAVLDIATQIDNPEYADGLDELWFEHGKRIASVIPSTRVSKLSEAPSRLDQLRRMRELGRIPGFPLGVPSLDNIILGVQGHELVTIAAFSGVGKSTLLQLIALAGYLQSPDHRPLFISLEMEAEALLRKFDAMAAKIQLSAIKALDLGDGREELYETWAQRCETAPNDIIIIDDMDSCTVERVHAETMRYQPSGTFVDYVQLMDGNGDNSYARVGNAIKGLKKIARMTNIPQFTAAQTTRAGKREGVQEDNIADSIEIFRSSDIMIGIDQDEEMQEDRQVKLRLVKNRDGRKGYALMNWDFEKMDFSEVEHQSGNFSKNPADDATPLDQFSPESREALLKDNPFATEEDLAPKVDLSDNPFVQLLAAGASGADEG